MNLLATTPLPGIAYYYPSPGTQIEGRDGFVSLHCDDVPLPLLEEDFASLENGATPDYDMVGRGIYQALRQNPDLLNGKRYVQFLQEAYPHYISELGSLTIMLDRKDVDPLYLDRKINYLKIFSLIEPDNARFPVEIGRTYLEKGVALQSCCQVSYNLFKAEEYLLHAVTLGADDQELQAGLAEVSYLLGRYDRAVSLWEALTTGLAHPEAEKLRAKIHALEQGQRPFVPSVDYLEAAAVAFTHFEREEYAEASAILNDLLQDSGFRNGYPIAELWYVLGKCSYHLAMPAYAAECLQEAITIRPDYTEAIRALNEL